MDPLFPVLPEDLSDPSVTDEQLAELVETHLAAQRLIRANDPEFLGDLSASAIIEQATTGRDQLAALRAEQAVRVTAVENYDSVIEELTADSAALEAEASDGEGDGDGDDAAAGDGDGDADADGDDDGDGDGDGDAAAGDLAADEPVTAAALRRPPAPTRDRAGRKADDVEVGAVLVASAEIGRVRPGDELDPQSFSGMMLEKAKRLGKPHKSRSGSEEKYLLASAAFPFPEDRRLTSDLEANARKIRALRNTEGQSLVASGGLCAPATNIYSIPQFATRARPVRDALPSFNADRGAVNVPVPTTLASAANAITVITEANDALGGTFATKSCLDQTCLDYVETAVTIISHCREYGNLNARSWPESVTFENELTMAEHARVAEGYLLDRIKAQSINVTTADVYSTVHDLIYAITRTVSSIRYILRTGNELRYRALLPQWVPDMMISDIAATQFDRFVSRARVTQILREAGVEPTWYFDTPSTGTTQAFADETAGPVDDFPDAIQFAVFPEGAFIHVDGGSLELGLVRDSTLNSTNDFQMFGETFENVALLAPAQAARWITATVCPSGEFPALTTALSC
jgi:hypothetical protein